MKRVPRKKKKAMKKEVIRCMEDPGYFVKKYLDLPMTQKKVLIGRLNHIASIPKGQLVFFGNPRPNRHSMFGFHPDVLVSSTQSNKTTFIDFTTKEVEESFEIEKAHSSAILLRNSAMSGQEKRRNRRKKKP